MVADLTVRVGGRGKSIINAPTADGIIGTSGVWTDVTDPGMNLVLSADNYAVMDVLVDPVRPQDYYAFVCYQGVWKSTDYGLTWTKITANGGIMDQGKPWGDAIDMNLSRNPATAPTMYAALSNLFGIQKSTNGGVTWSSTATLPITNQDAYTVDTDPYDVNHVIVGFHEEDGHCESTDGGSSWIDHTSAVPASCHSTYCYFIDTGNSGTTAQTWLIIGQAGEGATYRTTNQGVSFTEVMPLTHEHGNSQLYQDGSGGVWLGGYGGASGHGIYKSSDYGATWSRVHTELQNDTYGTANYVYALRLLGITPLPERAARPAGTSWSTYSSVPGGFNSGAKRVATSTDGTRWVTVAGCANAGIWRYIE